MGADYYAETYLGFEIKKEDFIRIDTVTTVLCAHEVPKGAKFCPECATPVKNRSKVETKEVWKDGVPISESDREDGWNEFLEYEGKIAGHKVIPLRTCSEDRKDVPLILGYQIGRVCGESGWGYDQNPVETSADDLTSKIEKLTKLAASLGLSSRPVKHYTLCYVSV